jgi:hypothetical protein
VRIRLRPAHTALVLAELYAVPHRHDGWPDHRVRVASTAGLGRELMDLAGHPAVIADLSCGDAVIPRDLIAYSTAPAKRVILGDIAPGYELHGPVEQTLDQITHVDMFVCSETIEHLDDPDVVLARIRAKADLLVLSTPLGETTDRNPEHYWGWDQEGVGEMLAATGWDPELRRVVTYLPEPGESWMPASYQLWGCR